MRSHRLDTHRVVLSPDGEWLATGGRDGLVRVFDVASARPLRDFDGLSGPILDLAVSPDGKSLAVAGERGGLRIFDMPSAELRYRFNRQWDKNRSLAWLTPNFLMAAGAYTVKAYDLALPSLVAEARIWLQVLGGSPVE